MDPTSLSLLDRLKRAGPDADDWERLHDLYLPLIRGWLARVPGLGDEAADLSQEVMVVVAREIPRFDRRREGAFRAWIRQVVVNKVRNHRRKGRRRPVAGLDAADDFLARLADPTDALARRWDREHDDHVVATLLDPVRAEVTSATWQAFRQFALEGEPARRVAEELNLSENAVLLAKSRVLKRLRAEAGELLG